MYLGKQYSGWRWYGTIFDGPEWDLGLAKTMSPRQALRKLASLASRDEQTLLFALFMGRSVKMVNKRFDERYAAQFTAQTSS